MIVTVFRSRLRDARREEYRNRAERMGEAVRAMPGCLSHKTFTAEDGERVNIVEFESEKTHRAWAEHAEHRVAQRIGRERFYREYKIHVCEVCSTRSFHYRSNQTSRERLELSRGVTPADFEPYQVR